MKKVINIAIILCIVHFEPIFAFNLGFLGCHKLAKTFSKGKPRRPISVSKGEEFDEMVTRIADLAVVDEALADPNNDAHISLKLTPRRFPKKEREICLRALTDAVDARLSTLNLGRAAPHQLAYFRAENSEVAERIFIYTHPLKIVDKQAQAILRSHRYRDDPVLVIVSENFPASRSVLAHTTKLSYNGAGVVNQNIRIQAREVHLMGGNLQACLRKTIQTIIGRSHPKYVLHSRAIFGVGQGTLKEALIENRDNVFKTIEKHFDYPSGFKMQNPIKEGDSWVLNFTHPTDGTIQYILL